MAVLRRRGPDSHWRVQRSHEKESAPPEVLAAAGEDSFESWDRAGSGTAESGAGAPSTDVTSLPAGSCSSKIWAEGAWITERHRASVAAFVSVDTIRTRCR